MSWEGWIGATSDGWAACQPPDPDTAQSAIFLKVPLSQTGVYAVMLRWSRLRPLWALIHRGLLALVEQNAGAKHPTAHFLNSDLILILSGSETGQCQTKQRGLSYHWITIFIPFTLRILIYFQDLEI